MASFEGLLKEVRGSAIWDGVKWAWCAGGAGMTTMVHAAIGYFIKHQDLAALLITGGVTGVLALVAIIIHKTPGPDRRGRPVLPEMDDLKSDSSVTPLVILSAKWGIGGDAFKDVTEIVRAHAKSDSINIPVSIGVLHDPYPHVAKRLKVEYSFARKWWVDIPEGQNLILPETIGQEQATIETERARQRVQQIKQITASAATSATEDRVYNRLRNDFDSLSWAQKLALLCIYRGAPLIHLDSLAQTVRSFGFGMDIRNDILFPLLNKSTLVKMNDVKDIELHPSHHKIVEELLEKWKEQPF
jgi:hypothetical protein